MSDRSEGTPAEEGPVLDASRAVDPIEPAPALTPTNGDAPTNGDQLAFVAPSSTGPEAPPAFRTAKRATGFEIRPGGAGPEVELEVVGDTFGARVERWLNGLGDRLNPILVKETRQAFKSRQFTIWFSLLLGLGWLWSFFGVMQVGPAIYDGAYGADLFIGYYTLLSFCLLVVVPFVSFRSLSVEREDKTYDLLQITALRPTQIITGKLGSAAAQILLYGSAIAPCLAFTYLLRGVPLLVMTVVMVYLLFASFGLSMAGIFAATLAKHRGWQTVLSLLLIVGLLYCFGLGMVGASGVLTGAGNFIGQREFWIITGCALTAWLGLFALLFAISVAEITFSADNRSTPGRIVTVCIQMAFAGWCGYGWLFELEKESGIIVFYLTASMLFWYAVGIVLESEPSEPSRRVRRGLPTSFLGRVGLTWFYPGPYSGYVFTLCNAAAVVATTLYVREFTGRNMSQASEYLPTLAMLMLAYMTIYLGVGNLLCALARRVYSMPHAPAMLINVLVLLFGLLAPNLLQWIFDPHGISLWTFRPWHASNPFWLLSTVSQQNIALASDVEIARWMVLATAGVVFMANIPGIVHEIRFTRTPPPKRVVEDEAALHPAPVVTPAPTNPWG